MAFICAVVIREMSSPPVEVISTAACGVAVPMPTLPLTIKLPEVVAVPA